MDLLDESSDEENSGFKINKDYADSYEKWRGKEVFQRLKDKHGEDAAENFEDSSEEDSEDSDAEELTEEVEKDFYKTLASLKAKDPKIYNKETTFFSESSSKDGAKKEEKRGKEKKITIGDMERKIILEKGGKYDDLEDQALKYDQGQSYAQELQGIKKSLKAIVESSDDEDDSLLKPRAKTKQDKEKEEAEYRGWLAGQKDSISDDELKESMSGLKSFWSSKELDSGEQFLKDYLLNKRYKDQEDSSYVPTYEQIVHDSDEGLSEDEQNVAKQEEFEHKFNFRFEEPDEEFIKRYPRTIKDSLRQTDDKRKKKRKEVEERKKAEKQQKKEELKMLKAMKKKEILEKLEKLKKITGNEDMALRDEDIEGDFDPVEYDKRMKEIFENYDQTNPDEEKPQFSDFEDDEYEDELEGEDWDNWTGPESAGGANLEEDDFNMDCDYNPKEASLQRELIENSKGRKNSRRKSKFSLAVEGSSKKPVFNPEDKTFEQYVDEYYKLDCEDIIGDMPCRFKYRTVEANDFGLTAEEVLLADDKDLNAWVSLRKTCQYRSAEEERRDISVFRSKASNLDLKRKLLPSIYSSTETSETPAPGPGGKGGVTSQPEPAQDQEQTQKKKKKKKKNKKRKADEASSSEANVKRQKLDNHSQNASSLNKQNNSENTVHRSHNVSNEKGAKVDNTTHPEARQGRKKNQRAKRKKNQQSGNVLVIPANFNKIFDSIAKIGKREDKQSTDVAKKTTGGDQQNFQGAKKKWKHAGKPSAVSAKSEDKQISKDRLKAYGLNPSKFNQMQRKQKFTNFDRKKS